MAVDEVYETLDVRKKGNEPWLNNFLKDVTKASAAKQLTVGGISGWCTGFLFSKVGKVAATTLGGSLLLFQLAQHQGYVKVNWPRLNRDIEKAKRQLERETKHKVPRLVQDGQRFVQENVFLATGFAGGFLLGLAS